MTNVVLNTCEAVSPASDRVEVRSSGGPDGAEISVSDNGPGILEGVRQAVFQPLVTYGKEAGTRLGLAIVQGSCAQMAAISGCHRRDRNPLPACSSLLLISPQ